MQPDFARLSEDGNAMAKTISRRKLIQMGLGAGSALLMGEKLSMASTSNDSSKQNKTQVEKQSQQAGKLNVAAVQFRSTDNLSDNVKRHCDYIRSCAKNGARVVIFPECSMTGYSKEAIDKATPALLTEAEATIGAACKEANVYAIVGSPTKTDTGLFNSALVFTPEAKIIERYHKVQLAESWPKPGDHMSVFPIDGVWCSIIICHDERYPELVRLPVLAGAKIVFYISSESGIKEERKIAPYRAQIMARAAESPVYIAHANAPCNAKDLSGSHGQSRLIDSDGNIITEASIFDEEVISTTFDVTKGTGGLARRSAQCEFLKKWWEDGVALVRRIEG